jgi:hypothetical protein
MTKDGLFEHYGNGERECPICNDPLPAHSTWPGSAIPLLREDGMCRPGQDAQERPVR